MRSPCQCPPLVFWKKRGLIEKIGFLAKNPDFWKEHFLTMTMFRPSAWKVVRKKRLIFLNFFYGFMAYFAILVKRKNVRFSVHTLRFGSVVSQGHFFGDPDSLTKFHRNFLENNKCLYVKNWRKRTTFYSRFRSQVGTPRFQNVIFGPFWAILGQFWAFLGHLGPFRVILGIFFVILGHFGPFWDIWGHIWAILGHFGSLTKINWSDVFGVYIKAPVTSVGNRAPNELNWIVISFSP